MRHHLPAAVALLASLAIPLHAQAAPAEQATITVSDAWARPSPGPAIPSAAYLTITDHGAPDHLTGVSTPVAGKAEVHESRNDNGVMKMRAVPSLPLEPNKPVTLAPGGYHIMLMELKQPLQAGQSFPLTLTFEKAPPQTVQVTVSAAGASGAHGDHGSGKP